MTRHTVIMPLSLRRAFYRWWALTCAQLPQNTAMQSAIYDGLRKPHTIKRGLTRHHVGLEDMNCSAPVNVFLPDETWADIHNHRLEYGLTTRSEAVRELLRLGIGQPQPMVSPSLWLTPSTETQPMRILQLAEQGLGPGQIRRKLGLNISRQRVHAIIQQARKGKGGIGELAAHRKGVGHEQHPAA